MKKFHLLPLLLILGIFAISCTDKNDPDPAVSTGFYVLNNGAWGANNASISRYDVATKQLTPNVFYAANHFALGDLGQDILAVGDELYISVSGSQTVFVTDADLVSKTAVVAQAGGTTLSPRNLCSGGGKVYVTYSEGYLGEIDPKTRQVRTTPVGPNPEGVVYLDGKIYTANSGGYLPEYNNTVSVVDAASFKEVGTIPVNTNPAMLVLCGNRIFVSSYGNYAAIPPKVQCINPGNNAVTDLPYTSPSAIAGKGSTLYVLCGGYDENWNPLPGAVYRYDTAAQQDKGAFVTDGTILENAYSLSVAGDFVMVGCSDYKNNGDVYVLNISDGKCRDKFDCGGINPLKIIQ